MEAVPSDKECWYYMKLVTFILGIGMEVLHTYFEQNILNAKEHLEFYMFLDDNKHYLFHECYPRVQCCKCFQHCPASPSQKGCLNKKQFMLLFDIGPLTEMDHYQTGRHNDITKECLCRIIAKRSNDVDCMDITLMYAIVQSCCFKNSTVIHGNPRCIEVIKDTRNFLAHVPNARISESEFDRKWSETEQAILEIGSSLGNYFAKVNKRKVDEFKNSELSMKAIKEIIENNVDEVKKDLQALIEDQKKSTLLVKDEIIAHLTKYKDELSVDIRNLRFEVKQYTLASCSTEETFDIEVPKMNAAASGSKEYVTETDKNVRKCRVEWRLETPSTWNLPEIKDTLEKFSALLRQWFEIEFVYVGSLVIKTLVQKNVLDNRDEMRTAVHLFLEKFVEVCRINSDEHTVITVALIVEPDDLDKEEAKEQLSKIEMNKKDITTCIFCNKSFDCQNCKQKAKTISRLEDELSEMDKDSPDIKFESDLENIGDNFCANKAQVATGHVLSPNANYARLIIAVKHITQNMLKEVLEYFIPPRTLVAQVRNQKWTQRLKPSDLKKINDAKNKGYIDFDLPLIYTILRNFRLDILPTRGWNNPTDPQQHEISLGDDIERCRRLYNVIIYRPNAMIMMISSQEFNDFLSDFKCIAKRFEIVLNKQPNEFVSQF